jgi:hypothetical protein
MIKRIWSYLTGGKLVWLRTVDGGSTLSIAYQSPFGDRIAKQFWPYSFSIVILLDDGKTNNGFIKAWKYVE